MEVKLFDYIGKCRCCLKPKGRRKSFEITTKIEEIFLKFVGIKLNTSPEFSSAICNVCKTELDQIAEKCEKFAENQKFLYQLKGGDGLPTTETVAGRVDLTNSPSKIKIASNVSSPVNQLDFDIKEEFEEVTLNPYEIHSQKLEEVIVKVESFEPENCVFDENLVEPPIKPKKIKNQKKRKKSKKFKCYEEGCKRVVNSQEALDTHMRNRHGSMRRDRKRPENDTRKNIICLKCGIILKSWDGYLDHMAEHRRGRITGTDDFSENIKKPCPICGSLIKPVTRVEHFKKHENELNQIRLHCDHCNYSSIFKNYLIKHLLRKHAQAPKESYTCEKCGKTFGSKNGIYFHRLTHGDKEYKCKYCEKTFKTPMHVYTHTSRLHGPKTTCEICGLSVTEIKVHIKDHHSGPFKCDVEGCGKLYKCKKALYTHKKFHHSENPPPKPAKKYNKFCTVPECDYVTYRYVNLRRHVKNHEGLTEEEKNNLINELNKISKIPKKRKKYDRSKKAKTDGSK